MYGRCMGDEPMLDPRCASPSYLHNGATTIAPVEWLRWSWSVYAPGAAAAVPAGGQANRSPNPNPGLRVRVTVRP